MIKETNKVINRQINFSQPELIDLKINESIMTRYKIKGSTDRKKKKIHWLTKPKKIRRGEGERRGERRVGGGNDNSLTTKSKTHCAQQLSANFKAILVAFELLQSGSAFELKRNFAVTRRPPGFRLVRRDP